MALPESTSLEVNSRKRQVQTLLFCAAACWRQTRQIMTRKLTERQAVHSRRLSTSSGLKRTSTP